MSTIQLQDLPWDFEKAQKMEKPWEYWNNGYTRYRKLQWEMEHKWKES